jgi:hypothetical protein
MRQMTRPAWAREAVALRYLARVAGDARRARQAYREAAGAGNVDVRARPTLMAHSRALVPREEWFQAEWLELPDRLATGFHFLPVREDPSWVDREVRRDQLKELAKALLPATPAAEKPAAAKPAAEPRPPLRGPHSGTTDQVTRDREALVPTLQAARQPGEGLRRTIKRLVENKRLKPPGGGDPDNMIDLLARVWGKAIKLKKEP